MTSASAQAGKSIWLVVCGAAPKPPAQKAQAAEADHLGVRVTIAAEAADAYFRVRGAQRRIAIAEDQIRTNNRLLDLVRTRQQDGLAARREVAQAEALVAQARTTVPPLRIELQTQLNRLDVLMGAQPGTYANELAQWPATQIVPAISAAQGPPTCCVAGPTCWPPSAVSQPVTRESGLPRPSTTQSCRCRGYLDSKACPRASYSRRARSSRQPRPVCAGACSTSAGSTPKSSRRAAPMPRRWRNIACRCARPKTSKTPSSRSPNWNSNRTNCASKSTPTGARDASEDAYKGGAVSLYEVLDEDRQLLTARDQQARVVADNARAAVATFRALGGGW
jgi:hypothetical protein